MRSEGKTFTVGLIAAIIIGFIGGLYLPDNVTYIGPIIGAIVAMAIWKLF